MPSRARPGNFACIQDSASPISYQTHYLKILWYIMYNCDYMVQPQRLKATEVVRALGRDSNHPLVAAAIEKAQRVDDLMRLKTALDSLHDVAQKTGSIPNNPLLAVCLHITDTCGTGIFDWHPAKTQFDVFSPDYRENVHIWTDTFVRPANCRITYGVLGADKTKEMVLAEIAAIENQGPKPIREIRIFHSGWFYQEVATKWVGYSARNSYGQSDPSEELAVFKLAQLIGEGETIRPAYDYVTRSLGKASTELRALVNSANQLLGELDSTLSSISQASASKPAV